LGRLARLVFIVAAAALPPCSALPSASNAHDEILRFDDVKEIAEIGLARSIPWRDPAAR